MYKCAICGREYVNFTLRNKCETRCINNKRKQEEEQRKKKLAETQPERKKEVDAAISKANELVTKYVDDYGYCDVRPYPSALFDTLFFK